MEIKKTDRDILRKLATRFAEIAALPVQKQNVDNWKRLNALNPVKPMVSMDQICWHELKGSGELTLHCENEFSRRLEWILRETLYRWDHFRCDMVVTSWLEIPKSIGSSGYGISIRYEDGLSGEIHQNAETHIFEDQIADETALEKIQTPVITHDRQSTQRDRAVAEDILGDILPVRMTGVVPCFRVWDEITFFRGVTPILYDFADRPEFLHAIMEKFTTIHLDLLRQYEALDLLDKDATTIHCSPAWNDLLPAKDFDGEHVRAKDCWASGMAQIFSSCSPAMFEEFEIEYARRYYAHCGLVNYGCCEPLHEMVPLIRTMHGIRKISTSPWANVQKMVRQIGQDFVLLRKPNPAFVAGDSLDEASVRRETRETLLACKEYGTPCEFILKDITTVRNQPERLTRWAQIVDEEIAGAGRSI